MAAKVRAASVEIKKDIIPLEDGYYTIHSSPASDYITLLNDYALNNRSKEYVTAPYWLGYYDTPSDPSPETCDAKFIWHFIKSTDSTFVWKNCGESSELGDSTYFTAVVHGQTGELWSQTFIVGTPRTDVKYLNLYNNNYQFVTSENAFKLNDGSKNFITNNPVNNLTWANWTLETIPASRITPKFKLNEAITDAGGILVDWIPGNDPGQLKMSIAEPLQVALASARVVYAKSGATDEEYTAARTALLSATATIKETLKDTASALNEMTEGYYRFLNANTYQFHYRQSMDANPVLYGGSDNILRWTSTFDVKNPDQLFEVKKLADGNWSVKCVGTGKYIAGNTKKVAMSDLLEMEQIFTQDTPGYNRFKTSGYWQIFGKENLKAPLHLYNANSGRTKSDYVELYQDSYSAWWYLKKETNTTLIDSLVQVGKQRALNLDMHNALIEAAAAKDLTQAYNINLNDGLITEANDSDATKNQFCSNAPQTGLAEFSFAHLIDGNPATSWISLYKQNGPLDSHYLQVDLKDKAQQQFVFKFALRGNADINNGKLGGMPTRYGTGDFGQYQRPIEFDIYATNDTTGGGTWKEVRILRNLCSDANLRTYYSPVIAMDQTYRYIRFAVPHTVNDSKTGEKPYWAAGEWQMYPAIYDEANSSYSYLSGMKAAVDELTSQYTQGQTQYAAGKSTQETIDKLKAATLAVSALNVDTLPLALRTLKAQILADSAYICDESENAKYGDVTTAQKAEFLSAIAAAKVATAKTSHPTQTSLQTAYKALNDAYFKFNKERKTFEINKWYFLRSTETRDYSTTEYPEWRGGHVVYATGNNPQAPMGDFSTAVTANSVIWGHYVGFNSYDATKPYPHDIENGDFRNGHIDCENYPYAMWRIVPIEGKDSLYAVQNRATGLYLGRRRDISNNSETATDNAVTQSKTPVGFQINLIGRNEFEIVNVDSANLYYPTATSATPNYADLNVPLHQQGSRYTMVWWGTYTNRGWNTGSSLTFQPANDDDVDISALPIRDNNIQIMCLPFAIGEAGSDLIGSVEKIASYKIKSITTNVTEGTSKLELTKQTKFDAGEPFILVTGDPSGVGTKDSASLYVTPPNVLSLTEKTVNGLVAVLCGDSITKSGLGLFVNGVLTATSSSSVWVNGHTGYIDPAQVVAGTGATDLTVSGTGILNQIRSIIATDSNNADVYSVDGKLIRKNAKITLSTKGLSKGVYIVGKKKILVQ